MTREDLKEGYVEFNPIWKTHVKTAFQKRMVDEKGEIKFFLNIYVYPRINYEHKDSFSAEVQFNRSGEVFNLEYFIGADAIVEDIEKVFDNFWKVNGCDYYEK